MKRSEPNRILFCGYAPVHYVCFRPPYERLAALPGMEVYFSGGLRGRQNNGELVYDPGPMYRSFNIPGSRILTTAEMQRRDFDMVFCSFVSGVFPRKDRARVHLFHGISFRNMAVRRDILIYDYLLNVGPYQMKVFEDEQLLRKGDPRMVPIGFPKTDPLVDGSLDRGRLLRRAGFSGRRPVVLYAPTGQKDNSLELMGPEVVKRLRATGRYDLLIKLHDHPRNKDIDWGVRLRPYLDAHTKIVKDYDIIPQLYLADLLLTDASSASSEYMLLDRPLVFIDVPQMLGFLKQKGLALDADRGREGGVTVRWPDEVVASVAWCLKNPRHGSAARKKLAAELFFNPGRATDKAEEWVLRWLNEHPRP